ncbi:MAG TPA: hypothetical protein VNQ97_00435 [Burkholderiaceae bacterium]|nr:hypothetical protein [Burkholderiaceae bacterium]
MITTLLLTCLSIGSPAAESHPLAAGLAAMHIPDVSWQEQQSVNMSGIPIHVRPFSSTLDAIQLARALASETERFQQLTTLADTLLLSGLHANAHWLAKIDVSATGSRGYVSVLEAGAAMPVHVGPGPDFRAWLPAGAAPLYRHRSISTGRVLEQHIYSLGGSTAVSMGYVRQQLRRQGWKDDPSFAGLGSGSAWNRNGAELTIFASAQPQGSALYIQHLE